MTDFLGGPDLRAAVFFYNEIGLFWAIIFLLGIAIDYLLQLSKAIAAPKELLSGYLTLLIYWLS